VTRVTADAALDADFIGRMIEDASGTLWIAGTRRLLAFRERLVRVKGLRPPFPVAALAAVRTTGAVYAQIGSATYRIDSDSAVLVHPASAVGGIGLWAESGSIWTVAGQDVLRDNRRVYTLPESRTASGALVDREGSLWLGTDAGGLYRLKPALFTTYSTAEGVGYPNVYATYVDRSGAIWLGTWGKGMSRLDPVTGRATVVAAGTTPNAVNSFYEDDTGALWIAGGQGEGGVRVCTPPSMTCRADGPRELRDRAVFALYADADKRLWAGAYGLLFRYDGRSWTSFPASSGAPEATVRAFANTRDGALWMGTNGGGLARYREGAFTRITRSDGGGRRVAARFCQIGRGRSDRGTARYCRASAVSPHADAGRPPDVGSDDKLRQPWLGYRSVRLSLRQGRS
jgi:ligand-binding sensor domain-containing protein